MGWVAVGYGFVTHGPKQRVSLTGFSVRPRSPGGSNGRVHENLGFHNGSS